MAELDEKVAAHIDLLSEQANQYIDEDDFEKAFQSTMEALKLVPEPRAEYEVSTWLYATLGDIYFLAGDFEQALLAFADAVQCPEGLGNPFIHLRLGQCAFENHNLARAADELTRAYMGAGEEIFSEEDPKYFTFLKTKITLN